MMENIKKKRITLSKSKVNATISVSDEEKDIVETAGTNTIKVSNPKGYAPNLDKIGVSVTTK